MYARGKMNLDLSGKTALVSGGARGIGAAISRALGAAGARVVINFNKSGEKAEKVRDELRSDGFEAEIFQADVSEPAQVEKLFEFVKGCAGQLDILVNNAGVIRDTLLLTMSTGDWKKVHDVNLTGAFLMTRMAAELMVPKHRGKIVNIASVSGIRGGRGQTNYASAKGGLIAFTRACAVELAPKGIQVNAVLPGFIETEMSTRAMRRAGETILERIPAHRFGSPQEVANLVVFLASDMSEYVTGQAIPVDGGLSVS
jgi:3-oxoacyl-[acyl-carrier protein] reductase